MHKSLEGLRRQLGQPRGSRGLEQIGRCVPPQRFGPVENSSPRPRRPDVAERPQRLVPYPRLHTPVECRRKHRDGPPLAPSIAKGTRDDDTGTVVAGMPRLLQSSPGGHGGEDLADPDTPRGSGDRGEDGVGVHE
ncbi:MAG: hypothetical protein AB7I08_04640 [Thermoleophilia bacterium]